MKRFIKRVDGWRGGIPTSEQVVRDRITEAQRTGATQVDLSNLGLKTLPSELWRLTTLTALNLAHNRLSRLPLEIGSLSALTSLDLSHNRLWRLPQELWMLAALKSLDLSHNLLTELPSGIGNLVELRKLRLSGNFLASGNFFADLAPELRALLTPDDLNCDVKKMDDQLRLFVNLRTADFDVQPGQRGRIEEDIGISFWSGPGSRGVIDISNSPVQWINVLFGRDNEGDGYNEAYFGVPDRSMGQRFPHMTLKNGEVRSSPLFGKVIAHRWKGNDKDLKILDRLNNDGSLTDNAMHTRDLKIRSHPMFGCWTIEDDLHEFSISKSAWNYYESVAAHLLASSENTGPPYERQK